MSAIPNEKWFEDTAWWQLIERVQFSGWLQYVTYDGFQAIVLKKSLAVRTGLNFRSRFPNGRSEGIRFSGQTDLGMAFYRTAQWCHDPDFFNTIRP